MTTFKSLDIPLQTDIDDALRIRAWKDEQFRQDLIANPKAVIEREFPEYFEDGQPSEQMTYKVIEEDTRTHYIVLPKLSDKLVTPEMPEGRVKELMLSISSVDITNDDVTNTGTLFDCNGIGCLPGTAVACT